MSGTTEGSGPNPLEMSDDEIMNLSAPPGGDTPADEPVEEEVEVEQEQPTQAAPEGEEEEAPAQADEPAPEVETEDAPAAEATPAKDATDPAPTGEDKDPATPAETATPAVTGSEEAPTPPATLEEYKAFYEKVMAPFRANGKTIQLKSLDEAIQLQQMGANYTRKMQAIAPHRKILLMLENNKLLDEDKLSFLIDIEKKNPEAIKKLLKDSGIDPLDIDTQSEPTYLQGNHRVSDEEANFRTTLEELGSDPEGKATLRAIDTQWDQASKEVLWKQPEVMTLIHQQRENGIYDRVTTEMERQRALGMIPSNVTFLQAYKQIGDAMANAGQFNDLVQRQQSQQAQGSVTPPATPVATRVQQPKPTVRNGDKASAASPTRSTPRKAETVINPLALSDEDFEKQFAKYQGRV